MIKIKIEEINEFADCYLQKTYKLNLTIPIVINNRLKRRLASFYVSEDKLPIKIELSSKLIRFATEKVLKNVLKHELTHFALFTLGKPCEDGHPYFENELKLNEIPSTDSLYVGLSYIFACSNCGKELESNDTRIKNKPENFMSACCNLNIKLLREVIYNGEN